jgi:hypothetical protein
MGDVLKGFTCSLAKNWGYQATGCPSDGEPAQAGFL